MILNVALDTETYPWRAMLLRKDATCQNACDYCSNSLEKTRFLAIEDLQDWTAGERGINIVTYPYPGVIEDVCSLTGKIVDCGGGPIVVTLGPGALKDISELRLLKQAGVAGVCFSLISATKNLDASVRHGNRSGLSWWDECWRLTEAAVELWGKDRVGLTLSVGLGETEQQILATMQKAKDMGVLPYVSPLEATAKVKVSLGKFYRILVGRYLIINQMSSCSQMQFGDFGQVIHFGIPKERFIEIVASGKPLEQTGLWLDCSNFGRLEEMSGWFLKGVPDKGEVPTLIGQICKMDWREAWITQRRVFELEGEDFDEDEIEAGNGSIYKLIAELGRTYQSK
ncbi:hypothetical protein MHLNE_22130 [Moorella humiferrea]|uniref:hypothetical protein n=1 Tax=Neomoorella humiferrea TaxID=676965 RepID=UPI0030CC4459